jgi:hypothetical protein
MNKSEQINELAKALAQVQAQITPAQFDSVNPYYKSKYASLGSVIEAAKILAEYGLSYSQMPINDGWFAGVENILMHESGQWISEKFMMPLDTDSKNPIQEAGKAITYARRYGLSSMLGIYSDEDTDGNSRSGTKPEVKPEAKPEAKPAPPPAERPYSPGVLKQRLATIAGTQEPASDGEVKVLAGQLGKALGQDKDKRHKIQNFLFGADSLTQVDRKLIKAGLKWLDVSGFDEEPNTMALEELSAVNSLRAGQQKMDDLLKDKSV